MTPKASCGGRDTARRLVRRSGNVVSLTMSSVGPAPTRSGPAGGSVAIVHSVARMQRAFSSTALLAGKAKLLEKEGRLVDSRQGERQRRSNPTGLGPSQGARASGSP